MVICDHALNNYTASQDYKYYIFINIIFYVKHKATGLSGVCIS